jgi:hypothetical protein
MEFSGEASCLLWPSIFYHKVLFQGTYSKLEIHFETVLYSNKWRAEGQKSGHTALFDGRPQLLFDSITIFYFRQWPNRRISDDVSSVCVTPLFSYRYSITGMSCWWFPPTQERYWSLQPCTTTCTSHSTRMRTFFTAGLKASENTRLQTRCFFPSLAALSCPAYCNRGRL